MESQVEYTVYVADNLYAECGSHTQPYIAKTVTPGSFSISPNPNTGNFFLQIEKSLLENADSEIRVRMTSLNGQMVKEKVISDIENVSINEDLPSGYYLISLIIDGKIAATEHFVVNK